MLSLVHGPVDVTPLDPLEPVIKVGGAGLWVDGIGLCFIAGLGSTQYAHIHALLPNGKAVRIGWRFWPGGFGYSPSDDFLCWRDAWGAWSKVEFPSTHERSPWLNYASSGSFGVLSDRIIHFTGTSILYGPHEGTQTSLEYAFADYAPGAGNGTIHYAGEVDGHDRWWCVDGNTGRVYLYDSTAKTEVRRATVGSAINTCGYSRKHKMFFVVRRVDEIDQLSVYADDPAAAAISSPTFTPTPRRGVASVVRARVTGSLGEVCAARNVRLEVSVGSVERAVVATDEDGWATWRYFGPTDGPHDDASYTVTLVE